MLNIYLRIILIHCYMTFAGIHMYYVYNVQLSFFFSQELLAIQQQGPRSIGFFGTRNMGFMHQELIEILSYAMVITVCLIHLIFSTRSRPNCCCLFLCFDLLIEFIRLCCRPLSLNLAIIAYIL